jgi:hypothetical protein
MVMEGFPSPAKQTEEQALAILQVVGTPREPDQTIAAVNLLIAPGTAAPTGAAGGAALGGAPGEPEIDSAEKLRLVKCLYINHINKRYAKSQPK